MGKVLVSESNLENIAEAIRDKNGTENTYTPSQMSSAITNLPKFAPVGMTFRGCTYITNLQLDNIDFSNVDSLEYMFFQCSNLTNVSMNNWKTSTIKNFTRLFSESGITTADLSSLDVSNATDLSQLFSGSQNLVSVDLGDMSNASKNTTLQGTFYNCNRLAIINGITTMNVSNVDRLSYLFHGCTSLPTTLDLSNWQNNKVTTTNYMFNGCTSLKRVDISGLTASSLLTTNNMFYNCTNLETLIINNPVVFKGSSSNTNMIANTKIAGGAGVSAITGYVYVPDNMVNTYKNDSFWSAYSNRIKGISQLPS